MSRLTWPIASSAQLAALVARRFQESTSQTNPFIHVVRRGAARIVRGWLSAYHRMRITGRDHLPGDGESFVMVANHASHLDALCLLSALPLRRLDRAYPAAAEDYFCLSLPRIAAARIFVNALPFGRQ